jgi:hypothetical protein
VEGYDIIGDVHGCATQLEALLHALGYRPAGESGEYRHPDRQAVFVGDLIDRGDHQLRVLEIVKAMVDAGSAQIVMGNHEFNALAYHTEWPYGSGKFLRGGIVNTCGSACFRRPPFRLADRRLRAVSVG